MKEYKTVTYINKISFNMEKKDKALTDFLNSYAQQGWRVVESVNMMRFILERDRNK